MADLQHSATGTVEVLLVAHIFVSGNRRAGSINDVHDRDRSEEEYKAFEKNWHLSRKITMPYHPQVGNLIRLPLSPQNMSDFELLLETAQRLGVPHNIGLFKVNNVTYSVEDELDHATCEIEAKSRDYAWNIWKQLQDGYGFKKMD